VPGRIPASRDYPTVTSSGARRGIGRRVSFP
jgi:hypothetical protein